MDRRLALGVISLVLSMGSSRNVEAARAAPGCLAQATARERIACLERVVATAPLGTEFMDALGRVLVEDPGSASSLARQALAKGGLDPGQRAALLDLDGQALSQQGRWADAADAFEASLDLDDGSTRLSWWSPDGRPAWTKALDVRAERIERAARALIAAGREEAARRVLERAIRLGARGWAVDSGWRAAGGKDSPGFLAEAVPILAEPPYPRLPDLTVRLLDGPPYALSSARGRVLLLDFWASWCAPCLQELPHLQALYEAEREHGLEAIAVNADEPLEIARQAARRLRLDMPIALYDKSLDEALRVRTLPTLVLVDREGRVRSRWDGYGPGLEAVVAKRVRELLGGDPEGRARRIAEIVSGAEVLEPAWVHDVGSAVEGLAVVREPGGRSRVVVSARGTIHGFAQDGEPSGKSPAPAGAGRLVALDAAREGEPQIAGFRAGGRRLVLFDLRGSESRVWEAASPILDVVPLPRGSADAPQGLALGTLDGLYLLDLRTLEARKVPESEETTSLAVQAQGAGARLLALEARRTVHRLDLPAGASHRAEVPPGSATLVAAGSPPAGYGAGPTWISASAAGRFRSEGSRQLAVATAAGQLVLLDPTDGSEQFRASWPGIAILVAADLDADGRDELVVASDRYVAVLRGRRARPTS